MTPAHLVDASLYVFRAYYAQADAVTAADGRPVGAVHGFTRFLLDLLERARPSHAAVAFDESLTTSFRNAIYPAYKANRDPAPEELKAQFADCRAVAEALGLTVLRDSASASDPILSWKWWGFQEPFAASFARFSTNAGMDTAVACATYLSKN